jgi:hypothetical protein
MEVDQQIGPVSNDRRRGYFGSTLPGVGIAEEVFRVVRYSDKV